MGTKLTLQQQTGPSSPSQLLSPLCCSLFLRGKEGENFSLPQWVQPCLASLLAHTVLAGLWLLLPLPCEHLELLLPLSCPSNASGTLGVLAF